MEISKRINLSVYDQFLACPICGSKEDVSKFSSEFLECNKCDFIFYLEKKEDKISNRFRYNDEYWKVELVSARERAWGISIARAAEVVLLAQRNVAKFLDIGTGAGDFLNAIQHFLPGKDITFIGVEKFPPPKEFCSKNPGFRHGWIDIFKEQEFDAGICIEVLEHLSVKQVDDLFKELYKKSKDNAIYLFNTGLTDYVRDEDLAYLDPISRGHISIWSVKAITLLVAKYGWQIYEIPNRKWAFIAEKSKVRDTNIISRIWSPLQSNQNSLKGVNNSNLLEILARDGLNAN